MSNQELTFRKGKVGRNELELPTLHFVVMDQWVDVIGERALFAWLKMYTWCKRDEETDKNQWDEARIPTSFNQIIKRLGVGRETFYKRILRPLWNVGLIDIEEYEDSDNKGSKPMNVVVYKYPQNNKSLEYEPIVEVRNYETDYESVERTFAKKGGRKKAEVEGCTEPVQGGVPNEYRGVYRTSTGGCTKRVHNNSLNNMNNSLNTINNNFNSSSNPFNMEQGEIKTEGSVQDGFDSVSVVDTEKHTTTIDFGVREIIQFWDENNFGHSIHSKEQLLAYLDDDDFDEPKEMILRAMQLACDNRKQSFSYVKTILHSWINKGFRTVSDVDEHETKRLLKVVPSKGSSDLSYGSIPKEDMTEDELLYWEKRNQEVNASLPDFVT